MKSKFTLTGLGISFKNASFILEQEVKNFIKTHHENLPPQNNPNKKESHLKDKKMLKMFDYKCVKCNQEIERLVDDRKETQFKCPVCGSKMKKILTTLRIVDRVNLRIPGKRKKIK